MLRLHSLIGDHMVLQKGNATVLSGWAAPGVTVMVEFCGTLLETVADGRGRLQQIREAQMQALALPGVGLVVTIDIGEEHAHPRNKQEAGRRLALAARAVTYGEPVGYSGPLFERMEIQGAKARLYFQHAAGLRLTGAPELFAIAPETGPFLWARAEIDGETVLVHHPEIQHPWAVRYGWAENPPTGLTNAHGLPASPFRTDVDQPPPR